MEAVMMHGSFEFDQATSPYKPHLKNPKKIHRINHPIISNFMSSGGGLLQPPPFLSQSQPPLLPLPTWKASNRSSSLMTAKKSKSPKTKQDQKKSTKKVVGIIDSHSTDARKTDDMFSGAAVFAISPPPSSLPLPTFSCCKAEAAGGVDAGATNDLRRLLRLR